MRLEIDLAIRREARDVIADDVAIGVGDGWHQLVGRALVKIRDVTDGRVDIRQIKERSGRLSIFTDAMIRSVSETIMQRVSDIINDASEASAHVCEMCGGGGRLIAAARLRVRCQVCEADESERQRIWQEHKTDIREAAAYYILIAIKRSQLFPVANIVDRVCTDDRDHRLYLDEVHDRLTWFRAGSWIEGVDEALRDHFRRLDLVQ